MDQEFGCGLAVCLWLKTFLELAVTLAPGVRTHWEGLIRGGSASQVTYMMNGRIQFLSGCWAEDPSSSLAVGWKPPSVPC